MVARRRCLLIALSAVGTPALAGDDDLVAALECRASVDDATMMVAMATNDEGYGPGRRWTREAKSPLYQPTYTLAQPITVFGHQVTQIRFYAQTIFAVVPGVAASALAKTLDVKPELHDEDLFMGVRAVKTEDVADEPGGTPRRYQITLHVTNFTLGSGTDTMAGCSYVDAALLPLKGG